MKVLAFSDLHRDRDRARELVRLAQEADVVVGAGDFGSMRVGVAATIDALSAIEAPAVLVPGNAESEAELWRACASWRSASVLHGEGTEIDGLPIFGLGGAVPPTPLPWSFDLSEEEAGRKLEDCPADALLVLHSPPKGYVDQAHGRSLGSAAVLSAIERTRPRLALCGHIHQAWGRQAMIGDTKVVNLGPHGTFFEL